MAKSVKEQVEDWAKKFLDDSTIKHFAKNAATKRGGIICGFWVIKNQ